MRRSSLRKAPDNVRYYAREGMKVRKNGNVYALSDTKNVKADITLSKDQLEEVRAGIADFSNNFSGTDFYDTYSFKYEMQGLIFQQALSSQKAPADAVEDDEEESGVTVIQGPRLLETRWYIQRRMPVLWCIPQTGMRERPWRI